MTSLVDLESNRTDYFDGVLGDVVEPSSSPSEGSQSPIRALTEETVAGLADTLASTPSSHHARGHDPVFNEHDDFHRFRKGHRSHTRDSTSSSKKLSSLLMLTSERLDKEIRRANDAERRASEAIALARSANEAKLIAQRDATRANEELRMYKLQYDNAQQEIYKAQGLIDQIEAERQDAEAAAARARSTARKLKEQNLIIMAREEGRQLGYQEGLATGRRMAYEDRMSAGDYTTDEDVSEDEVVLPEHPSNIRLRSPTPGAGSRPSSRPPAARQPPPPPPPPMRPPSRNTRANFELVSHSSTLATSIKPPQQTHVGSQPPPIHLEATPPPRNRARSKSDPLGYPPDTWIPVADEKSFIAMPPPHHMSPSPSPVEPPRRMLSPAPVPPPPVLAEEATVDSSTTSETFSETTPPQSAVRAKDYAYHASRLRERDEGQPQRSRTPVPSSPGSTRMSDYGILSSPQVDQRKMKTPVQIHHFEIEKGSVSTGGKVNRSWSLRKKKETASSSPVRIDASPAEVTPPATEDMIFAPRPRKPGKSPLSRVSPSSSSSSSSTSTAKASTSSTSSTDRTKLDPRKDPNGESRTPLGWLFKKRMKEHTGEKGSSSSNSVDITVESPSESNHSLDQRGLPGEPPQPTLLTPDYKYVVLAPEPPASTKRRDRDREASTSTPKPSQNLPPLAEFTNLISPGQGSVTATDLPPGFIPNPPLPDHMQQGGEQSPRRSASMRSRRKDKEPTYETAPLIPGVHYPTPPVGADIPRSKSRASRSSRQGQIPGALTSP